MKEVTTHYPTAINYNTTAFFVVETSGWKRTYGGYRKKVANIGVVESYLGMDPWSLSALDERRRAVVAIRSAEFGLNDADAKVARVESTEETGRLNKQAARNHRRRQRYATRKAQQ